MRSVIAQTEREDAADDATEVSTSSKWKEKENEKKGKGERLG